MPAKPSPVSLLAIAAVLAASVALPDEAEARKRQRTYQPPGAYQGYYYQPRSYYDRQPRGYSYQQQLCEERAQAADPTGLYAGYPCWAREAFGRTPGGRR